MSKNMFAEKEEGVQFSFWLEGDEQAEYHIAAFKVEEALFSLTKIEVLLKISSSSLDYADRLGKRAGLCIKAGGLAAPTHFSGIIAEATEFFEAGDVLTRFVLLPHLAKLEREPRYRVFQELTVPDIVETILCEHGFADALWQLEGDFIPRRFCMQYGESDLAFMHRILAEEDIFYYFIHEDKGRQRPVLCNNIQSLLDCPNGGSLRHDSHGSHGLYDMAGAAEVYCHSLRRSFSAGAQAIMQTVGQNTGFPGKTAQGRQAPGLAHFFDSASRPGGTALSGIAHLPLPLCGHKLALQCQFDKSLNSLWYLTAVRHEGIGAESGLLSRDLADYFAEAMDAVRPAYAESVAMNGVYGRAFGATSLLPRLSQVNGGPVYEGGTADFSPYGVLHNGTHNTMTANVISMQGSAHSRQSGDQTGRKAVYACAFTALDGKAVYRPPVSARPIIAGPQEAQLIHVDKGMRRYKLALQISAGGRRQTEEVRFWAAADTQLGMAVAAFANAIHVPEADKDANHAPKKLLLEFLGGNPDKPIVLQRRDEENVRSGRSSFMGAENFAHGEAAILSAAQNGAEVHMEKMQQAGVNSVVPGFDDAVFEDQIKHVLDNMPWNKEEDKAAACSAGSAAAGSYPYIPHYATHILPEGAYGQADSGQKFIHVMPHAYNGFSGFDNGMALRAQAGMGINMEQNGRSDTISLARIQADLKNSTAQRATGPDYAHNRQGDGWLAAGSRFLEVEGHQREDIHGVYELNCGEKYLCKTRILHMNAADRLVLRGPGGKIIIDKYSMTLEAPLIRLKGRLAVEEYVFDRQEGIRTAIRDELPLVTECGGNKEVDDGPDR